MTAHTQDPEQVQRLNYPVDGPLHVIIDREAGTFVIEAPILEGLPPGDKGFFLRLNFSAQAASGFIRALREVESHLEGTTPEPQRSLFAH